MEIVLIGVSLVSLLVSFITLSLVKKAFDKDSINKSFKENFNEVQKGIYEVKYDLSNSLSKIINDSI